MPPVLATPSPMNMFASITTLSAARSVMVLAFSMKVLPRITTPFAFKEMNSGSPCVR